MSNKAAESQRSLAITPNFSAFGQAQIGPGLYSTFNSFTFMADMWAMAETDETVGAMFWCVHSAIRQITFEHVPQIDGVDDTAGDAEAKKHADFMNTVLKDMNAPFGDHVEDALTMMWAGFSTIEMVTKRRDGVNSRFKDNFYGLKSLNLISQITIHNWDYSADGTELMSFRQAGNGKPVPLYKTLLYRTTTAYNMPQGRPLLQNAWRAWKLKRKVQDSEAIGIERDLCGLPVMRLPKEVMDAQYELESDNITLTKEAMQARAMVQNALLATQDMRLNKSGGLVLPSDTWGVENGSTDTTPMYDFSIVTTGGQRSIDARTAARDYDHSIARVILLQFLMLGQRSGGSYGLSDDQSSMALASINALTQKIVDEWNHKAVPYIWQVNGFDPKYRPRLRHGEINKTSVVQLGQFLAGLGKGVELWASDPKMRVAAAKAAGLPYDVDAQNAAAASFLERQSPPETEDPEDDAPPKPAAAPKEEN